MHFPTRMRAGIARTRNMFILTLAATSIGQTATAAAPNAVITPMATSGMAPFTVHVHAQSSTLGAGNWTEARIQWDFDDSSGYFNHLEGQNAAHMYTSPGQYVITLTLTSENGQTDTATQIINVQADTRPALYVSADGHDSNPGTSTSAPLATLGKALDLLQDNWKILLRRGDTFEVNGSGDIEHSNVLVSAYGSGAKPKLLYVGGPGFNAILRAMASSTQNVTVEKLRFDSIHNPATTHDTVDGFRFGGRNITVWNCKFDNVSIAVNNNQSPQGVLVGICEAQAIASYFSWVQGTDHVFLGNEVGDSYFEHVIRLANTDRVLIAHNDFTNSDKCTIWAMLGEDCAVVANSLYDGRVCIGPNPAQPEAGGSFKRLTFERNYVEKSGGVNAAIDVLAGSDKIMFRNNVVHSNSRPCFHITGYDAAAGRTSTNIDIVNNTGLNDGADSRFTTIEEGADNIRLRNNLYVAPNLVSGIAGTSNVYIDAPNLASLLSVSRNVWAIPDEFFWVPDGYHYVWPYWSDASGYKSPSEWNAYGVVSNEAYENVSLNFVFAPPIGSIAAAHATPYSGVHTDFYGHPRPATAPWAAGAVNSGATGVPGHPYDLDGDGVVDFFDLLVLLSDWGDCTGQTGGCPADLDDDGAVEFFDLLLILDELI